MTATTTTATTEASSSLEVSLTKKRTWPLKLHDCWSYRDFHGKSRFFPDFCPTSCLCGNMMIGRLYSRLYDEKPRNCCDLGCFGCAICIATAPFGAEFPIIGNCIQGCIFCWCSLHLRNKIKAKYNVEDTEMPSCCSNVQEGDCCHMLYVGVNFPCSLFQMYESILYWDQEEEANNKSVEVVAIIQENPVIATKK